MNRPQDKYKSENKTVIAQLCGIPVCTNADELESLMTAKSRNLAVNTIYDKLREDYDCKLSVRQYKKLIDEIRKN